MTIGLSFARVLSIAAEFGRVTSVLVFQPEPPKNPFRDLKPLFVEAIEHYESRCMRQFEELLHAKADENVSSTDVDRQFDKTEELLDKYSRLLRNLEQMQSRPHVAPPRPVNDYEDKDPNDVQFGSRRYISQQYHGYGFSNDYVRQWLAAVPGRIGRHFEKEEAGTVNLTTVVEHISLAMLAGASLLVPMIIMEFLTGRNARLIIVSVATILFGMVFGVVSESKENILAGVAAYAAIMVVYVGSANGSG